MADDFCPPTYVLHTPDTGESRLVFKCSVLLKNAEESNATFLESANLGNLSLFCPSQRGRVSPSTFILFFPIPVFPFCLIQLRSSPRSRAEERLFDCWEVRAGSRSSIGPPPSRLAFSPLPPKPRAHTLPPRHTTTTTVQHTTGYKRRDGRRPPVFRPSFSPSSSSFPQPNWLKI